jgi:hypothetical protein
MAGASSTGSFAYIVMLVTLGQLKLFPGGFKNLQKGDIFRFFGKLKAPAGPLTELTIPALRSLKKICSRKTEEICSSAAS